MKINKLIVVFTLVFLRPSFGFSQQLFLDSSFLNIGKVVLPQIVPSADENCNSMALNSDGSIILAGNSLLITRTKGLIIKLKENGVIDSTFGTNGAILLQATVRDTRINDVLIQSDGKIVVLGDCTTNDNFDDKFLLARYFPNGTIDSSFGTNGLAINKIGNFNNNGVSLAIQNDGKFLVAGSTNYFGTKLMPILIRFTNNGFVDITFNSVGYNYINDLAFGDAAALKVLVNSDNKISICGVANISNGNQYLVYRFTANGILDNSFNSNGGMAYNYATGFEFGKDIVETANQKILALGWSLTAVYNTDLTLFNSDASIDSINFIKGHMDLPDTPNFQALKIQNYDSGFLIACDLGRPTYEFKPGLMVVKSKGNLASNVSDSGIFASFFEYADKAKTATIKVQANNKVVQCGSIRNGTTNSFWVARILPFSIPNDTMNTDIRSAQRNIINMSIYPNPIRNGRINIQYKGCAGTRNLSILDINGKTIYTESKKTNQNEIVTEHLKLPGSLSTGVYFLKLKTKDGEVVKQFEVN